MPPRSCNLIVVFILQTRALRVLFLRVGMSVHTHPPLRRSGFFPHPNPVHASDSIGLSPTSSPPLAIPLTGYASPLLYSWRRAFRAPGRGACHLARRGCLIWSRVRVCSNLGFVQAVFLLTSPLLPFTSIKSRREGRAPQVWYIVVNFSK